MKAKRRVKHQALVFGARQYPRSNFLSRHFNNFPPNQIKDRSEIYHPIIIFFGGIAGLLLFDVTSEEEKSENISR